MRYQLRKVATFGINCENGFSGWAPSRHYWLNDWLIDYWLIYLYMYLFLRLHYGVFIMVLRFWIGDRREGSALMIYIMQFSIFINFSHLYLYFRWIILSYELAINSSISSWIILLNMTVALKFVNYMYINITQSLCFVIVTHGQVYDLVKKSWLDMIEVIWRTLSGALNTLFWCPYL